MCTCVSVCVGSKHNFKIHKIVSQNHIVLDSDELGEILKAFKQKYFFDNGSNGFYTKLWTYVTILLLFYVGPDYIFFSLKFFYYAWRECLNLFKCKVNSNLVGPLPLAVGNDLHTYSKLVWNENGDKMWLFHSTVSDSVRYF